MGRKKKKMKFQENWSKLKFPNTKLCFCMTILLNNDECQTCIAFACILNQYSKNVHLNMSKSFYCVFFLNSFKAIVAKTCDNYCFYTLLGLSASMKVMNGNNQWIYIFDELGPESPSCNLIHYYLLKTPGNLHKIILMISLLD